MPSPFSLQPSTLPLTHLRFDCTAVDPIKFGRYKAGHSLRNALAGVMLRSTCPERQRGAKPTPEHAATCPACYLLAADTDPGSVVRGYTVIPPLPVPDGLAAGQAFSFGLTLFGDAFQYLPYFVLAVEGAGHTGVGYGGGRFELNEIWAFDPLGRRQAHLMGCADRLVQVPEINTCWDDVAAHVEALQTYLAGRDNALTFSFRTPLRLSESRDGRERIYENPDFAIFFRRLLFRIDWLGQQFAGEDRRPRAEVEALHAAADRVRLVKSDTTWHELWSGSRRKQKRTPLSGLVGSATYRADDWSTLLPYLVWGQAVQVGKSTTKGNGVYALAGTPAYWRWLESELLEGA